MRAEWVMGTVGAKWIGLEISKPTGSRQESVRKKLSIREIFLSPILSPNPLHIELKSAHSTPL